jgi:hypothetical protein
MSVPKGTSKKNLKSLLRSRTCHTIRVASTSLIDYGALLAGANAPSTEGKAALLVEHLPGLWGRIYLTMTPHQADIHFVRHGSFQYMFDHCATFEASSKVSYHPSVESRLVAAFRRSKPNQSALNDFRLIEWGGAERKATQGQVGSRMLYRGFNRWSGASVRIERLHDGPNFESRLDGCGQTLSVYGKVLF